jgi:arylsulfatase
LKKRLLITAVALTLGTAGAKDLHGSRPNILLVMTDDQGPMLSCMGHPVLQTPHIDQFAEQSLRFTEFHVSPSCSPTRAALLSGVHEFKVGVTGTVHERECMALSATLFPELLQQSGYQTGIFGKWHLGDPKPYRPGQRGFSEALTHGAGGIGQLYPGSCADFPPNNQSKTKYFDNVLLHNETVVQTKGYCTDVFFDAALGWMKKQIDSGTPFFCYLAPNAPHSPLIAPPENVKRIEQRHPGLSKNELGRWGMVENIDDNFGNLMQTLSEWDVLENTLVIFTTDNGMQVKDGNTKCAWTGGYKTGKTSPGEGGTHVPCFWYWKGTLQDNIEIRGLTAHLDCYKTFCDLAGVTIPDSIQELDGRTLLPLLENPELSWPDRMLMIHSGRWKGVTEPPRDSRYGVRTQRWRMVGKALYDIANDPYEKSDVSKQYPEVVQRLNQARYAWWETVRPLMINENRSWHEDEPPLHSLYNTQKTESGIPNWMPEHD